MALEILKVLTGKSSTGDFNSGTLISWFSEGRLAQRAIRACAAGVHIQNAFLFFLSFESFELQEFLIAESVDAAYNTEKISPVSREALCRLPLQSCQPRTSASFPVAPAKVVNLIVNLSDRRLLWSKELFFLFVYARWNSLEQAWLWILINSLNIFESNQVLELVCCLTAMQEKQWKSLYLPLAGTLGSVRCFAFPWFIQGSSAWDHFCEDELSNASFDSWSCELGPLASLYRIHHNAACRRP